MLAGNLPWQSETMAGMLMMIHITKGQPSYPHKTSEELKSFLNSCFKIAPSERANVFELLNHPFIQNRNETQSHYG